MHLPPQPCPSPTNLRLGEKGSKQQHNKSYSHTPKTGWGEELSLRVSLHHHAAVYNNDLSGDVGGIIAGEEGNGFGNIFGCALTT